MMKSLSLLTAVSLTLSPLHAAFSERMTNQNNPTNFSTLQKVQGEMGHMESQMRHNDIMDGVFDSKFLETSPTTKGEGERMLSGKANSKTSYIDGESGRTFMSVSYNELSPMMKNQVKAELGRKATTDPEAKSALAAMAKIDSKAADAKDVSLSVTVQQHTMLGPVTLTRVGSIKTDVAYKEKSFAAENSAVRPAMPSSNASGALKSLPASHNLAQANSRISEGKALLKSGDKAGAETKFMQAKLLLNTTAVTNVTEKAAQSLVVSNLYSGAKALASAEKGIAAPTSKGADVQMAAKNSSKGAKPSLSGARALVEGAKQSYAMARQFFAQGNMKAAANYLSKAETQLGKANAMVSSITPASKNSRQGSLIAGIKNDIGVQGKLVVDGKQTLGIPAGTQLASIDPVAVPQPGAAQPAAPAAQAAKPADPAPQAQPATPAAPTAIPAPIENHDPIAPAANVAAADPVAAAAAAAPDAMPNPNPVAPAAASVPAGVPGIAGAIAPAVVAAVPTASNPTSSSFKLEGNKITFQNSHGREVFPVTGMMMVNGGDQSGRMFTITATRDDIHRLTNQGSVRVADGANYTHGQGDQAQMHATLFVPDDNSRVDIRGATYVTH